MKILNSDHAYPALLRRMEKPPLSFYFQGNREILNHSYLSVVGSREVRPWVEQWMENELLPTLKELKIGVISGGARGVDQLAHRMALRAGVPTLIVLPSGLNKKYPKTIHHFEPFGSVGFISIYEPNVGVRKHHFYGRNQVISGLSRYCLVAQASQKSGTMITAKAALDIGNELLVLPGNAGDSGFGGNNQLLFDGATMVRNRFDLIPVLSHQGQ